jgi:hypothetical protein
MTLKAMLVWAVLAYAIYWLYYWIEEQFRLTRSSIDALAEEQRNLSQRLALLPPPTSS